MVVSMSSHGLPVGRLDIRTEPRAGPITLRSRSAPSARPQVVRLLLERGASVDREAVKSGCRTALHFAAGRGMVDTMAVLLAAGADPSHERDNGETVLLRAAREGKTPVVQALLQAGVIADATNAKQHFQTALHMSALKGKSEVARLLIENGADVNAVAADGKTPLFCCASSNSVEIAELLLDHGAEINVVAEASKRLTPLHYSAWKGCIELTMYLLERGASWDLKNSYGNTAFDLADQDELVFQMKRFRQVQMGAAAEEGSGTMAGALSSGTGGGSSQNGHGGGGGGGGGGNGAHLGLGHRSAARPAGGAGAGMLTPRGALDGSGSAGNNVGFAEDFGPGAAPPGRRAGQGLRVDSDGTANGREDGWDAAEGGGGPGPDGRYDSALSSSAIQQAAAAAAAGGGQPVRGIMGQKSGRNRRVLATSSIDSLHRVPDRELMEIQAQHLMYPPEANDDYSVEQGMEFAPRAPPEEESVGNMSLMSGADSVPMPPPIGRSALDASALGAVRHKQANPVHSVSGRTAAEVLTAWAISQESR